MRERIHRILRWVLPPLLPNAPAERDGEPSLVFPASTERGRANGFLIETALRAIERARAADAQDLDLRYDAMRARTGCDLGLRPSQWPGEHYRLLTGLVEAFAPRHVVEVGTGGGLSALALRAGLPAGARITTFDLVPWDVGRPFEVLSPADFEDGSLVQILGDLSDAKVFARHADLLASADFVFLDGPKDGSMEPAFLARLDALRFDPPRVLLVMDDIRLWNLIGVWRSIGRPKLDLTSFGHWSGTGLVQWQ